MRTKKCKFHLPEPTKSNTLNLFIAKKYQNENAVHSRPARAAILSQIGGEFSRFSVALVDLSEPDPYEDPHEPRPGNRIDFKQDRGSWDVHAPEPDRSRPDIGKNLLRTCISRITSRRTTEPKPGNHRIYTKITRDHTKKSPQWGPPEGPTEPRPGNLIDLSKIAFRMPMTVTDSRSIDQRSAKIPFTRAFLCRLRADPLNRNREIVEFSPKSSKSTGSGPRMSLALTDHPGIG